MKMRCVVMNSVIATMIFDRSLFFLHGKKILIIDTQRKYISLTMYRTKETSIKDDFAINYTIWHHYV
jgi:hypothetical protein